MTHVNGYFKKDGTYVKPHEDKRGAFKKFLDKHAPTLGHLFDEEFPEDELEERELPHYPNAVMHPERDEKDRMVQINEPSTATPAASWSDKSQIATVVPGGKLPAKLNGIAFKPWTNHPGTPEDWDTVEGQDPYLDEPPFESLGKPAAGVVVEEPDGRVWVIHPTNQFGGYKATFPKGRLEDEINLQASAIKEAFEESGLKVEITGFLADVERSVTTARYYTAKRVGGTPAAMGWESQAVSLVPRSKLYEVLNSYNDHPLAEAMGAGPQPPKPPKPSPKPYAPAGPGSVPKFQGEHHVPLPWAKPSQDKPSLPPPILQKKSS